MKMRKIFMFMAVVAALVLSLALTGCSASPVNNTVPVPAAPVESAKAEETVNSESSPAPFGSLSFSTTSIDGSAVNQSILEGKSLVMLNLWEPWCGPCVQEMPDLQKLYEEYKDDGFLLVGVYSTEDGAANIVEKLDIGYPVIKMAEGLSQFQTGYVPTTVFFNGEGELLGEPVIGSLSYDMWKQHISAYMP